VFLARPFDIRRARRPKRSRRSADHNHAVVESVAAVALRESLRDLAATVIFLVFRPFEVGDQIERTG
jgi:hypothetical protein